MREVDLAVSRAGKREARELCIEELRNRSENDAMHTKDLALIADTNYDFAVCQPVVVPPRDVLRRRCHCIHEPLAQ